jgi:hypothetical protein
LHEITLGSGDAETTVPVYAQSLPYLLNRTRRFGAGLMELSELKEPDVEDLVGMLGGQVYGALCAVIPALEKRMPEHQFLGFASKEAQVAGDVDEDALKNAPTLPQIKEAFAVATEVNGLNVFQWLIDKLDPQMLRAFLNARVAEALSTSSPNSPQQSGDSTQRDSGTSE